MYIPSSLDCQSIDYEIRDLFSTMIQYLLESFTTRHTDTTMLPSVYTFDQCVNSARGIHSPIHSRSVAREAGDATFYVSITPIIANRLAVVRVAVTTCPKSLRLVDKQQPPTATATYPVQRFLASSLRIYMYTLEVV